MTTSLSPKFGLIASTILALAVSQSAAAANAPVPGGLHVGYYQEDPKTNPEDPTPGAFVLKLPEKDASFNGAMFFTFVGCQTSNVGKVDGIKAGNKLHGEWSGTIDNSAQSGPYEGTYDPETGYYTGVYSNKGGKQFRRIGDCIQYYIGPNGTWEMFSVGQNLPAGFMIGVTGSKVSWDKVPNGAMALVYVIDPAIAQAGGSNPVKFQTVLPGPVTSFDLSAAGLAKGKEYVVATLVNNGKFKRVAFASKRFVAR